MRPPPLEGVQDLIWRLITAPEGVEKELARLAARGDAAPKLVDEWIVSDEKLSATGRLDVYANMYFYRLKDSLLEDYPLTAKLLGPERFHNLITDFLLQHPSRHYSLRYAGDPLPGFLAAHAYAEEFPYAAGLAALEWARADAHQAENSPVLDQTALSKIASQDWGEVRFRPVAGVHLAETSWDIDLLWDELQADRMRVPEKTPQALLVYREDNVAAHRAVSQEDVPAIRALLEGRPFAEVCELLVPPNDDVHVAARRASEILADFVNSGLISSFRF